MNVWVKWDVQSKEQMPACQFHPCSLSANAELSNVHSSWLWRVYALQHNYNIHRYVIDILFSLTQSDRFLHWCAQSSEEELLISLFCLYFTNTRVIKSAEFLASTSVFLLHTSKGTILFRFPIKAVFLIKALCPNVEPFFKVTLLISSGHHVGKKNRII